METKRKGKQHVTDDTEDEGITDMQDNRRASGKYTEGDERGYPIYDQLEEKHVHEVSNVFQFQSLSQSSYCNKYNPPYLDS